MQNKTEQLIKSYKSGGIFDPTASRKFRKDAEKLAKQGWLVQSQSSSKTTLTRREVINVVYVREGKQS